MPWAKLEDVPPQVRTHDDAELTLDQANFWAKTFDDLVDNGVDEDRAAAIAWTFFKRHFRKSGDEWVRRSRPLKAVPMNPPGITGRSIRPHKDLRAQRHEDPTMTLNIRDRFSQRLRALVKKAIDQIVKEFLADPPLVAAKIQAQTTMESFQVRMRAILQTTFFGQDSLDIFLDELKITINRASRRATEEWAQASGATPEQVAEFLIVFDQPVSDEALNSLALATQGVMTRLESDLASRIIPAIQAGIEKGESIQQIAKRIRDETNFGFSRATTIARTETIRTFNDAAKVRYSQHGVEMVEWITAGDERVDPDICEPLEGARFLIDAAPPNPAHPRCRCSWLPVVVGGPRG